VGYLYFNFPPAKLFMGDSGSLLLGFLLGILPLIADSESGTSLLMPITMLLLPIMDVFFAIARRTLKKIPFSHPDMEHLHHKLLALGLENRTILALVSMIMLILAIPVLLFFVLPSKTVIPYIILVWIMVGGLFMILHMVYHRKTGSEPTP
jgi:UDP-GlcNAc:undecaprenyl-phosphate GlcNAc-1-phosphate transferase